MSNERYIKGKLGFTSISHLSFKGAELKSATIVQEMQKKELVKQAEKSQSGTPDWDSGFIKCCAGCSINLPHGLGQVPSKVAHYFTVSADPKENLAEVIKVSSGPSYNNATGESCGFILFHRSKDVSQIVFESQAATTYTFFWRYGDGYIRTMFWR